jgi:hypothetical protein
MIRSERWVSWIGLLTLPCFLAAEGTNNYSIKTAETPAPTEVAEPIRKVLGKQSVQLLSPAGKPVCEVWFRKEIPADATSEQIKNGLTYSEVKQSEVVGAIRFDEDWRDYRKQKVKAGAYTLRLGYQPMDGDHTGASEYQDFLLLLDAAKDRSLDLLDAKQMIETSAKSIGTGHPAVFMLFPNSTPGAAPALAAMPKNHWVLQTKEAISVDGKKTGATLGFGLTLVGAAD